MKRSIPAHLSNPHRSALSFWKGRTVVITAGPTREALDPVRFLSNSSSGRMGYALARIARQAGARVILISGPTNLDAPAGVRRIPVISASEMLRESLRHGTKGDLFIGAAAVADWRPAHFQAQKMKKTASKTLTIRLVKNPDILKSLAQIYRKNKPLLIGFALETSRLLDNARKKLKEKSLDMIIANPASVIDRADTKAYILRPDKPTIACPRSSKESLARRILSVAAENLS